MPETVTMPEANRYVFPAYWGGMVVTTKPPQIHGALKDLRRAVGSLAAKKQQGGPQFPVRSAKELMQKLAEALDELNLHAFPIAQEVHHFDTEKIPSNSTASGKPVFRTLAHVKCTVRVGAGDGSYVDFVGSGHGGDVDDKAGGKADTYSWKSAILKGLCVPEQDMTDTDDDSSDTTGADAKKSLAPGNPVSATVTALADTLAALKKCAETGDEVGLEKIGADVKSGKLGLAGADMLKVSTAFVRARKMIEDAKKTESK